MEGSLRSARVRLFLLVEAVSAVGTWATFIAIWGYAAFEFDATAADVTLFGVMLTLPGVLLGPVVGTVVDRLGPKASLALAKAIGVVASLALLTADDFRTLALLSLVHGVAGALTIPALHSMPPRLVARRRAGPDECARVAHRRVRHRRRARSSAASPSAGSGSGAHSSSTRPRISSASSSSRS